MSADPWFAPKRYGYGAGLPIRWQGWVVLTAYLAVATGGAMALPPRAAAPVIVVASILLAVVAARRTAGGWRWRWRR